MEPQGCASCGPRHDLHVWTRLCVSGFEVGDAFECWFMLVDVIIVQCW